MSSQKGSDRLWRVFFFRKMSNFETLELIISAPICKSRATLIKKTNTSDRHFSYLENIGARLIFLNKFDFLKNK